MQSGPAPILLAGISSLVLLSPLNPELSAAPSAGTRSSCRTLAVLAPASALLSPVGGEGLLLRTSGNVPTMRLITLAVPSLSWGPSSVTLLILIWK